MIYQITVKPGSFKDEVIQASANSYTIKTRKKAHDGEANAAVISLLSKHFHVGKTSIKILKGANSRHKTVEIV